MVLRPFVRSPLPLSWIVTSTLEVIVKFRGIAAALRFTLPESPLQRMASEENENAMYVFISHGDDFLDDVVVPRYEVTVHVQLLCRAILLTLNVRRNNPACTDVGGLVLFSAIK